MRVVLENPEENAFHRKEKSRALPIKPLRRVTARATEIRTRPGRSQKIDPPQVDYHLLSNYRNILGKFLDFSQGCRGDQMREVSEV